eukprot:gnl/MRDRNA2_/MRDRNA2_120275_c0_seq1.p1 gnl/MRDRNA2_/MRDRNA2_120275_c0~~gnl/MRDRNA2_/MRDRNA2_120275_c0_seq1.p1  ORF type:complete len:477 (-),score=90.27 gnl/MRDRNA2_/MRDRNA2_120275_c0_seq1:129-1559(-)
MTPAEKWVIINEVFHRNFPRGTCSTSQLANVLTKVDPGQSKDVYDKLVQASDVSGDSVVHYKQFFAFLKGPENCFSMGISDFVTKIEEEGHITSASTNMMQAELEQWWKASGAFDLHELVRDTEFEFRDAWAEHLVRFISCGLLGIEWESKDSARAKEIESEADYIAKYSKRLLKRTDVSKRNLYEIKLRADETLDKAAKNENLKPEIQRLLAAIAEVKPAFKWSQGGFGPKAYRADFLTTYANTMISDSLWKQKPEAYQPSFENNKTFLECGIFYIDAGTEYPLHYHEELEAYYILYGKTRFYQLLDGKIVAFDREAGEWHFNPPYVPHSITSPHGTPHLSLWFREGGPGQEANNKFGPKWIGCCEGLDVTHENNLDSDDENDIPCGVYYDGVDMKGAAGFGRSTKLSTGEQFFRILTPHEFMTLQKDPNAMKSIDSALTPTGVDDLKELISKLQVGSCKNKRPYHSNKTTYVEA